MITLLRAVAGLVLGLVIFAGLLYFLVLVNFFERLVTAEVYAVAISDTGAYNRVYDEVLVDEALQDQTEKLLGDIEIEAHDEAVELLRDVLPPVYLQEQTEDNIDRFTSFLRGEVDELELYAEMEEPLARVEPAVLAKVYDVIDGLEITEPAGSGCSVDTMRRLASASAAPVSRLSNGKLPESAPSLKLLTRPCREQEFDRWFDVVLSDPAMNSQASLLLGEAREELRQPFVEGDTRAFLKAAAAPLIKPLTDDAIADIRRELQPNDRLDFIEKVAEESEDLTREDIEAEAERVRDLVAAARSPGKYIALLLVVVGSLLLAVVHLPRPAEMLRWPGIALALGGGVCLGVGFVVNSAVPGRLKEAIAYSASYSSDVPVSAINLAGDLLESFGRQATAGFIPPAVAVIFLGAALVVVSVFLSSLVSLARKILPGQNR